RGPPAGQRLSRPVSFETSLRSGPRHWGQSAAQTSKALEKATTMNSNFVFICYLAKRSFTRAVGTAHSEPADSRKGLGRVWRGVRQLVAPCWKYTAAGKLCQGAAGRMHCYLDNLSR